MKNIKKISILAAVFIIIVGMISGCTADNEGKAVFEAMMKTQKVKSYQSDMELTFKLDAEGLSEQDKANIEQIKAVLNDTKITMSTKQTLNDDYTAIKTEGVMEMLIGGILMNMDIWVDMDMNGTEPKFLEIIKFPAILTAADPTLAGKEYMVMDLGKTMKTKDAEGQVQNVDFAEISKMIMALREKLDTFIYQYMSQYDPGFKFISDEGIKSIETPEGTVKAHVYNIKLDDKAVKKLVRYTVNNLADYEGAIDYAEEYIRFILEFTKSAANTENFSAELEKKMEEFEAIKPELLTKFNSFMDQIDDIKLIGDKGIIFEYAIDEEGYLVSQSGSLDFVVDMAALESINNSDTEASGTYYGGLNFNMLLYNINKDINIEIPVLTPENSIDFNEFNNIAMSNQGAQTIIAVPTSSKVLVNGKQVSFDGYTVNGNNYFKLRDIAYAVNGTNKQFDVCWDEENKSVNLISNKAYTVVGGEMSKGSVDKKEILPNTSLLFKDGEEIYLEAYNLDGNNYFKLRDIAQIFDIGITWDETNNTIEIDTSTGYENPQIII